MAKTSTPNPDEPPKQRWLDRAVDRQKISSQASEIEKNVVKHAQKFVVKRFSRIREVKRQVITWGVMMVILFVSLVLQIVLGQLSYSHEVPTDGGSYREGDVGTINSLNPLFAQTRPERTASQLLFSRLFRFDDTGRLKNDLAKSLTVSSDERTYTITLRDDALWHDQQPLTAEDVVFTLKLLQNPASHSGLAAAWQGIEVKQLGDFSIEIRLPAVYVPFKDALTFPILPKHLLADVNPSRLREADFSKQPVGSGPFKFQLLRTNNTNDGAEQVLHLAKFDQYYGLAPLADRFELFAFGQRERLLKVMQAGEINAAVDVDQPEITELASWHSQLVPLNNATLIFFNTERGALKEVQFRQALRQALNLGKIRQEFNAQFGPHQPLDYPLLSDMLPGLAFKPQSWFNREQATKALQDLGYQKTAKGWQDAQKSPLNIAIAAAKTGVYSQLVDSIARDLREFGITVQVNLHDLADQKNNFVRNVLQPRDYDLLVYEIEIGSDPDQFAYWHSSQKTMNGLNLANYSNPVVDDLLASARVKNDNALRSAKYKSFVETWAGDAPAIAIHRATLNYGVLGRTQTFNISSRFVAPEARFADLESFAVEYKRVYATP